jgi:hypothetical protein
VIVILPAPAANEVISTNNITTAPVMIGFRIVTPPVEIALIEEPDNITSSK